MSSVAASALEQVFVPKAEKDGAARRACKCCSPGWLILIAHLMEIE